MVISLILCLVRRVRIELSKEAIYIRQLSPREYWEKLVSVADQHVSPDMSERDWARLFGWNGSVLKLMIGDDERDPDDPDYDKKAKVYREGLRYAKHKRHPHLFCSERIGFPDFTK